MHRHSLCLRSPTRLAHEVAQSIADAPGRYILLIPDGDGLRVLSHD